MNSHLGLQARIVDYEDQPTKSDFKPAESNEDHSGLDTVEASAEAELKMAGEDVEREGISVEEVLSEKDNDAKRPKKGARSTTAEQGNRGRYVKWRSSTTLRIQ
jgi:hypothetical protein